jgi:autotransporter translocation and assembly factor TamB
LAKGAVRGKVGAELPDPSDVSWITLKERVAGRASVSAEIDGRFDDLKNMSVSASVKGERLAWRGMRADSLDAHVTVTGGVPRLSKTDAKLYGRIDSVAAYFGQDSLPGYVEAELSMDGWLTDPFAHAQVWGKELRYGSIGLDEAYGVLTLDKNTIRWNNLRLREKGTALQSSGMFKFGDDIDLQADGELYQTLDGAADTAASAHAGRIRVRGSVRGDTLQASCRVTSASLGLLDPWLPEKHRVKGTLSLSGRFYGTPENPGGRVNFQVTDPRYYGNRAFTLVGDVMIADSLAHAVSILRLSKSSGAVEVVASLPFLPASGWKLDETGTRPAQVRAGSQEFNIATVTGFLEPDVRITGKASFDAHVTNAGKDWNLSGTFMLPDGKIRHIPNNIEANGVNLTASASGTLANPQIAYAAVTDAVEMAHEVLPVRVERSFIKGRSVRDTLFVDEARFTFRENARIDMSGMMLYSGADSLFYNRNFHALYTVKNFPSSYFTPLLPEYNMRKGLINGSGVVYAENGRPMADGTLYLSRLELTVPDIFPSIGPIEMTLKLDGNVIAPAAKAKWGRGEITATGRVSWDIDSLYDMDLNIRAADLAFELPEVIQMGVQSADVRVFDQADNINVEGRITLAPTSYIRDIDLITVINQMQSADFEVRREPDPFWSAMRLKVDLDLANNMHVNINLGSVFMDGRLVITGTAADPGIVGEIRVTEGFVYYLDRKFIITEGSLFNSDMRTVNPNLNIIAKSEVVTYSPTSRAETFVITMSLLGTLENPMVRLSAEPTLSELDIISVLTFGERMGGMGSDISDRLVNLAAQQALGLGTRRLERLLNIDRISVSGDILGSAGSQGQNQGLGQGAKIGVTKRFSSRLNLTYETGMGNLSDQKVTAQYRLLPNLYLEGQTTNNGENALDLIFRYSR